MADTSQVSASDSKYNSAGLLTGGATGSGAMDKDAFLLLLVTQFQYQDPLNPMEDKEFIAQLAQFSALEQSMAMNGNMEKLLAATEQQQSLNAVGYIGKEVLARGFGISVSDEGKTITKVQYALDGGVASGFVTIMDANRQNVTTIELPSKGAGVHNFEWDGRDSSGAKMPDGVYTIAISATDANGQPVIPDTQVGGIVKGISNYNGEQYLTLSDERVVAIKYVREIRTPTTKPDDKPEDKPEDKPKDDPVVNPHEDPSTGGTGTGGTGTGGTGTGGTGTGGTGTGTGGTGTGGTGTETGGTPGTGETVPEAA